MTTVDSLISRILKYSRTRPQYGNLLASRRMNHRDERIEVADGVSLHVEVTGHDDAPPLLLVNGAFATVRWWDHAVERWAERFRVVRHDVRGTGRSDSGPDDSYRFEQYAADLIAVCGALDIERAHLCGAAWGARVALVLAATYPERVQRLVLADLGIDPADPEAQRDGAIRAKQARSDAGIEQFERTEGWNTHRNDETSRRAIGATRLNPDLMPFVERVAAPTLIATGEFDPNLVSSRRALGGLVDGRLEVLPLTGHGAVGQRPDLFADIVTRFLAG